LPVARMLHRSVWRLDGHADGIRDAVADGVRIAAQAADGERLAWADLAERRLVRELVLAELGADEAVRELRAVDRDLDELAKHVRQRADVVLVRVRHEKAADPRLSRPQVGDVGDDEIDAQHLFVGEHEAGVDDDDVVARFDRQHVLPDLADTTERDDPQAATSSGSGSRFSGGRCRTTFVMNTFRRSRPIPARSSSRNWPAAPTNGLPCTSSWYPGASPRKNRPDSPVPSPGTAWRALRWS